MVGLSTPTALPTIAGAQWMRSETQFSLLLVSLPSSRKDGSKQYGTLLFYCIDVSYPGKIRSKGQDKIYVLKINRHREERT